MITINKKITKVFLLDKLIEESQKQEDMVFLIESLPSFLSSTISFKNFIYTIQNYPRKIIYTTDNSDILIFLRKVGAKIEENPDSKNKLIPLGQNILQKTDLKFSHLTFGWSDEDKSKKAKAELPKISFDKKSINSPYSKITYKINSIQNQIFRKDDNCIDFDEMLIKINNIKGRLECKPNDRSSFKNETVSLKKFFLISSIFLGTFTIFFLVLSLFPPQIFHKVYLDYGEGALNKEIYLKTSDLQKTQFKDSLFVQEADLEKSLDKYIQKYLQNLQNYEKISHQDWFEIKILNPLVLSEIEKTDKAKLNLEVVYKYIEVENFFKETGLDENIYKINSINIKSYEINEENLMVQVLTKYQYKNVPNEDDIVKLLKNNEPEDLIKNSKYIYKIDTKASGINLPWSKKKVIIELK